METFDTLYSRKSVRSYTGEPVSDEELKAILKAAEAAPVGMGQYDDMHLTLIKNPEILSEIDKAAAELFGNPSMHPLYGAPLLILVSGKIEQGRENVVFSNAAMIIHNMALAATDLKVGSCDIWGAVRALNQKPELVARLGLPEGFTPCSGIVVGKTDAEFSIRDIPAERIAVNTI